VDSEGVLWRWIGDVSGVLRGFSGGGIELWWWECYGVGMVERGMLGNVMWKSGYACE